MNLFPFVLISLIYIFLKYLFTIATPDHLQFFLKPLSLILGFFTSDVGQHIVDQGYYHEKTHILIDKSCSGFSFFLISFLTFNFFLFHSRLPLLKKFLVVLGNLVLAYAFSLFVNGFRILSIFYFQEKIVGLSGISSEIVHEGIGIFLYLFFLIFSFLFIQKFLEQRNCT